MKSTSGTQTRGAPPGVLEVSPSETSRTSRSSQFPRAPVLDWNSFRRAATPDVHSVGHLPHVVFTTSGRAAIYQALMQLQLPTNSLVLIPTYHCPTMVAPIICAHLRPTFYGIGPDGLPDLHSINVDIAGKVKAMIVAHYFGLPQSLAKVRSWCDRHDITLIEDCAHCFFGMAGERPVGAWGDYATASLSKFFPVPEAGLVASASRPISRFMLGAPGIGQQVKGCIDVLEHATQYGRLHGLGSALALLFTLKNRRPRADPSSAQVPIASPVDEMLKNCDMARVGLAPLKVSMLLNATLPRGNMIARRQANYELYEQLFAVAANARPLFDSQPEATAPYVFPLWVDDADRVYAGLRAQEFPVFRWDRIWPGTPSLPNDNGQLWSRHVLQLLCHQSLSTSDVAQIAHVTLNLLEC